MRPLEPGDRALLETFYSRITENDRWYMRYDVINPDVLKKWFAHMDSGQVKSIIALCGDQIVGQIVQRLPTMEGGRCHRGGIDVPG